MSVASATCSPISCTSRVAAHHEQGRGHLVAVGVRGNNVDLVGSLVQLSHCYESALIVDVDEIPIDADDGIAERDATNDECRCGKRYIHVVVDRSDYSQKQRGPHALVSHR